MTFWPAFGCQKTVQQAPVADDLPIYVNLGGMVQTSKLYVQVDFNGKLGSEPETSASSK